VLLFVVNKQVIEDTAQVTDNAGRTCLHVAASSGHYDMVQVLIGQGADLNVADKVGRQEEER
jgi:ankyrin repeat protein